MLKRQLHCRFEISDNRRLTGYASVFGQEATVTDPMPNGRIKRYREVIIPGAFTDSLKSRPIRATINHEPDSEFASTEDGSLLVQQDPHGLFWSTWLPDDDYGERVRSGVLSGEITGCSFGFLPRLQHTRSDGTVERLAVDVFDVCVIIPTPTIKPAYSGTEVHVRTNNSFPFWRARRKYTEIKLSTLYTKKHNNPGAA